jgi:hypothetical protein
MAVSLDQYHLLTTHTQNSELKNKILNNISDVMKGKIIFFLYKDQFIHDSRSRISLSHRIIIDNQNFSINVGESLNLFLNICNNGDAKWLHENIKDIGIVRIGTHLYDKNHKLLNYDFSRHNLARPIQPGETFDDKITITFIHKGIFILAIDMVSEGVCWFEDVGSTPRYITINVK